MDLIPRETLPENTEHAPAAGGHDSLRPKPSPRTTRVSSSAHTETLRRAPRPPAAAPAVEAPLLEPVPASHRRHGLSPLAIVSIALDSLRRNKTRSLLAMLGIIIGVGSVIAMMGLGEGTRLATEEQIRKMGSNTLAVRAGESRQGAVKQGGETAVTLKLEDAEAIRKKCPAVAAVAPRVEGSLQVKFGNHNDRTTVYGTTPEFFPIRNFEIDRGRVFNRREMDTAARVCIIGAELAETLFPQRDPLGKDMYIKGQPFHVIGILKPRGGSDGNWDERVWTPLKAGMNRLFGLDHLTRIEVQASSRDALDAAQDQVTELLRKRHHLREDDEDDFRIFNQADLLETADQTSRTFTALLAGIAAVSLIVGGIGIMNIMLVSVVERTREIGIRRAIGARRGDVLSQFITESLVMCGFGAAFGVLVGLGACWIGATYVGWPVAVQPLAIGLSATVAIVIGLLSGFYPALRAARLDPILALRHQ